MRRSAVRKRAFWHNLRPSAILFLVPITIGVVMINVLASGLYSYHLANLGGERLKTDNWQAAASTMLKTQPTYARKYAYYDVRPGQTVKEVARYFSVQARDIVKDNPGRIVPGANIKVTPVESPLRPIAPNGRLNRAIIVQDGDLLRIQNKYLLNRPIVTDIPELARRLRSYHAITKTGPKSYRLNRPISIEGDIRVDITSKTVSKLALTSTPDVLASLVFDESSVLFRGVSVFSFDPSTGRPDLNSPDGRAFLRMKNGRMDVIDSKISYLGNGLKETLSPKAKRSTAQQEGGTYGISWRISDDKLGSDIATGWVSDSTFEHNHFGAYSFGASGIMWKDNLFYKNEVYGLDPHDDSNNAMVEGNTFEKNGKHGFIVSKRCNYNIIRNNRSIDNKLHGFMLHKDSAFNLIENNISVGNVDNFVIYESNSTTVRNNKSYVPRSSHIRVNSHANNTFITGNQLYGGSRGIYLYGGVGTTYVSGNKFNQVQEVMQTTDARDTFFGGNTQESINYDIGSGDSVIFGENRIEKSSANIPDLLRQVSAGSEAR